MSAHIHTTYKIHVTSVTRVTVPAKHPDSLTFNPVTLQHAIPNNRCNARRLCNATTGPLPSAGRHSLTLGHSAKPAGYASNSQGAGQRVARREPLA
jgi:hypothetical protein